MKALKVIGIIVAVIGIAGFVFWFTMVRAPAPEDVCAHLKDLMSQNAESKHLAEAFDMKECVEDHQKGKREGAFPYAKKMKCLAGLKDIKDMDSCAKR